MLLILIQAIYNVFKVLSSVWVGNFNYKLTDVLDQSCNDMISCRSPHEGIIFASLSHYFLICIPKVKTLARKLGSGSEEWNGRTDYQQTILLSYPLAAKD